MPDLSPGDIVWAFLDPTVGREQRGRRPAVVISSRGHLHVADTLVIVVPVQVRTISRERVAGHLGQIDEASLAEIRGWVVDFIVD